MQTQHTLLAWKSCVLKNLLALMLGITWMPLTSQLQVTASRLNRLLQVSLSLSLSFSFSLYVLSLSLSFTSIWSFTDSTSHWSFLSPWSGQLELTDRPPLMRWPQKFAFWAVFSIFLHPLSLLPLFLDQSFWFGQKKLPQLRLYIHIQTEKE